MIVTEKKEEYQRERKHIIPRACTGLLSTLKILLVHILFSSALRKTDFCHLTYSCVSCDKDNLKRFPPETQLTDCTGVFFGRHE
jgi:hypothetical protein